MDENWLQSNKRTNWFTFSRMHFQTWKQLINWSGFQKNAEIGLKLCNKCLNFCFLLHRTLICGTSLTFYDDMKYDNVVIFCPEEKMTVLWLFIALYQTELSASYAEFPSRLLDGANRVKGPGPGKAINPVFVIFISAVTFGLVRVQIPRLMLLLWPITTRRPLIDLHFLMLNSIPVFAKSIPSSSALLLLDSSWGVPENGGSKALGDSHQTGPVHLHNQIVHLDPGGAS